MKKITLLMMVLLAAATISCKKEPVLNISVESLKLDASSGSQKITVQSSEPWSVSSDSDWISCSKRSGEACEEPVSLNFYVNSNSTGEERKAVITFTNGQLTKKVDVTQLQNDILSTDIYKQKITAEGGTFEITVKSDINYTINIPSDATWIKMDQTKVLVEKKIYFIVDANKSDLTREASITIQGTGGASTTLTVIQLGLPSILRYVHSQQTAYPPVIGGTDFEAFIDWGDGTTEPYATTLRHVYDSQGRYTVTISGSGMASFSFAKSTGIEEIDSSDF